MFVDSERESVSERSLIDPSVIIGQKQLYMDFEANHGASYGKRIFWDSTAFTPEMKTVISEAKDSGHAS